MSSNSIISAEKILGVIQTGEFPLPLKHAHALEVIARLHGSNDWRTHLAAHGDQSHFKTQAKVLASVLTVAGEAQATAAAGAICVISPQGVITKSLAVPQLGGNRVHVNGGMTPLPEMLDLLVAIMDNYSIGFAGRGEIFPGEFAGSPNLALFKNDDRALFNDAPSKKKQWMLTRIAEALVHGKVRGGWTYTDDIVLCGLFHWAGTALYRGINHPHDLAGRLVGGGIRISAYDPVVDGDTDTRFVRFVASAKGKFSSPEEEQRHIQTLDNPHSVSEDEWVKAFFAVAVAQLYSPEIAKVIHAIGAIDREEWLRQLGRDQGYFNLRPIEQFFDESEIKDPFDFETYLNDCLPDDEDDETDGSNEPPSEPAPRKIRILKVTEI